MSSILKASHKRKAETFGKRTALTHIFYGATEPLEDVLSGETADELTPYDLATEVGFPHEADVADRMSADDYSELLVELADVFESAYVRKFAQVEECVHTFTGKTATISDKARCRRCGVHVMSGSTLI